LAIFSGNRRRVKPECGHKGLVAPRLYAELLGDLVDFVDQRFAPRALGAMRRTLMSYSLLPNLALIGACDRISSSSFLVYCCGCHNRLLKRFYCA
jgi:hypothetical protein